MNIITTNKGFTMNEKALKECLAEVNTLAGNLLDLFVAIPNASESGELVKDAYLRMLNASRAIRNELGEE